MRTITLSTGPADVRPLTRGEIKQGADIGFGALQFKLTVENFDATLDYALGTQLSQEAIDKMSAPDARKFFQAIIAETWGSEDEEKNLSIRSWYSCQPFWRLSRPKSISSPISL